MMNDQLTLYYYTAWDGFAWQGCDAETAKSLQAYMEATRTLPKSSADVPPFGGAVACKIAGQFGVAIYRYLTRKKGDLSGRDSLYLALAFVPLSAGCVDFSAVLALPKMNTPQPGALQPQPISLSQYNLRLADTPSEPHSWWEKDISDTEYHVLKGKQGLRRLSTLFFSPFTQLGFLMAVFRSDSGLDDLVSTQSYRVFPEVADVVRETTAVRRVRELNGGVLERDHPAVLKMKAAFVRLQQWADKQAGYVGLSSYYHEQMGQMDDQDNRLKRLEDFIRDSELALGELKKIRVVEKRDLVNIKKYAEGARAIQTLPILDHKTYRKAMGVSLDVLALAATLCEREAGASALEQEKVELARAEELREKTEKEKKACEQENETLRKDLEQSQESLKQEQAELAKLKTQLVSKAVASSRPVSSAQADLGSAPISGHGQTNVTDYSGAFGVMPPPRPPSRLKEWLPLLAFGGLLLSLAVLMVFRFHSVWGKMNPASATFQGIPPPADHEKSKEDPKEKEGSLPDEAQPRPSGQTPNSKNAGWWVR